MNKEVMFSSGTDLWATPNAFYDQLNNEFHFDLDPCADATNHKCDLYFTQEQDGLLQDWSNHRVFCNPPYGKEIAKWVKKAHDTNRDNNSLIVMLLPARTDTRWFHDYIYGKAEIRFIKGRLKFGGSKNPAPFPSMVVVYGGQAEKQTPLRPIFEADGYADGELVYDTWYCPGCDKAYEVDSEQYKYCPNCGQTIDWREEE